jgi:7-alpha-hydroxysteroid dehydrogenase
VILDKFRLDGQVAVVTGAGRGLGAAIAVAFAEVGADVVIASRTLADLEAVAAHVAATGRRAHIVVADLAQPEKTAELAAIAVEAFGRLDIVVNNVGGSMPNALLTTTVKEMRDAFTFNVLTAHALTVAAVPLMLAHSGGGNIINISSTMGRLGFRRLQHRQSRAGPLHPAHRAGSVPTNPRQRHRAGFDHDLGVGDRRVQ